jgi:hypothetical protein
MLLQALQRSPLSQRTEMKVVRLTSLLQEAAVAKTLAQQRETEARAAHVRELDRIKATEVCVYESACVCTCM